MSGAPGVLVVEHQDDDPPGLIGQWLDARGMAWSVVHAGDPDPKLDPDPADPAAIVSLGSSHSAYAAEPAWIGRHRELLRGALAAGTPVLGVCFGAQALALAAGGEVAPADRPEVGWVRSESAEPELAGSWLAWHSDAITAPADAVALARSPDALQAFRLGPSLAVQFHPEVTPAIWDSWAASEPEMAERHLGDPARFAAEVRTHTSELRTRVFALLDWWWRSLG